MAIAKSAPHIYLSALPFAPTCSLVSTHYSTSFPRILHVERGQLSHWPSSEMVISNFGAVVLSVAFSPDGQHIVSGSDDRTIRVWSAMTGETAAGPFTGHTHSVNSVAFSRDGRHIVSGSSDRTIRVWNAMTGETAAGPFTGHTGSVNSVAFSPDGQHIVSGSFDQTIRVSNVTIGKTETANDVDFTDDFMINDEGWICGSKGELLMWIPSVHREYLYRRSTIWISGNRGTGLNLSNFVHGRSWATCINTRY
jgi:WD40 repeat protein